MLKIVFLLVLLIAGYVAIIMLRNFYYVKNSQSLFQRLTPTNNVRLKAIYDDHSTVFIQASYKQLLTEEEIAELSKKLHASQALHSNEKVWQGDWEDFCTKDLSPEIMLKFYKRSTRKPIDPKKVVFFIGVSRNAIKRFYSHLKHSLTT